MINRRTFLLSSALALASCSTRTCKRLTNNVVCLGDSVTAGIDATTSYPQLLQIHNRKLDIINSGDPGGDAGEGDNRFITDVISRTPHTCIIMFGLNDMKSSRTRMRNALISIITKCNQFNIRPILCTPSPHMELNNKLVGYADTIRDVARYMHVDLVDIHANFPLDGALMATVNHPNDDGHQLIFNLIRKVL